MLPNLFHTQHLTIAQEKVSTLKKVDLLFDNHRCCIEGKLGSAQLLKLVELLEEVAC